MAETTLSSLADLKETALAPAGVEAELPRKNFLVAKVVAQTGERRGMFSSSLNDASMLRCSFMPVTPSALVSGCSMRRR